ncbi:MAG: T9SS type A sorting domain-containing protein, partial [Candidatus Eisenbacteria bacterium]|nr:T9SS type A sorting domain-containing protein [Candidatus Eisenbacteria bacterium]
LSSEGGLWIDDCSPLIEDCTVLEASWHGVYVTGGAAGPTLRRVVSHGNANDGIDADSGAGLRLENCVVYGNGGDGVCLSSGANEIVGCLVYGNGEDGIDSHGTTDYAADIVNCTIGPHPSEGLSDDSNYRLYNALVVDSNDGLALAEHSLVVPDLSFFGFVDPGSGDYRLSASSPAVNYGTRFGTAGVLVPAADLDGNPRVQGIIDAGAYESSHPVDDGTAGAWFSSNLIEPRLGQPVLREAGESFRAVVGLLGSYSSGQVQARLVDQDGATHVLNVSSVTAHDLEPGTVYDMMIYSPGLETVQEVVFGIPAATPQGFYGIEIDIAGRHYFSCSAVSVYDEYPESWGLIHITDPHIGYDEESYTAAERLQLFVSEANFLNPEVVIVTGDVCENQNLGHDWPQQYLGATADLRVPVYVIPGNHDHYNDGHDYNAAGWLRYFHEISRYENSRLSLGGAVFYGVNTQFNYGLAEFYRCHGASDEALDWVEADASMLGSGERPRFLLMHGPNYDYFSWNKTNVGRVRDAVSAHDFDLCLAGHTHRFETYLNSGTNSLGRNDFEHEDDWERDVAFPGYPLHVQTSSLGKEEHLNAAALRESLRARGVPDADRIAAQVAAYQSPRRRGLFGDDIGWRWVQVDGTEVAFFTADTDGDGYRNTEDPWLLGEISFDTTTDPDGTIHSTVTNAHHETWTDCRHYVPADPVTDYAVSGGTLVRRLPDGTAVVAVDSVGPQSDSVVVLSPTTGVGDGEPVTAFRLHRARPNPFNPATEIAFDLPERAKVELEIYSAAGRRVAVLASGEMSPGRHRVEWRGRDEGGEEVGSGVYFVRLRAGERTATSRVVLVK